MQVDVADNVDLLRIIQEWEEGQEQHYGRKPKLVKRLADEVRGGTPGISSGHPCNAFMSALQATHGHMCCGSTVTSTVDCSVVVLIGLVEGLSCV